MNLHHMRRLAECNFEGRVRPVTFVSGALALLRKDAVNLMPEGLPFPSRGFMYLDDIILGPMLWERGFASLVLNEPVAVHFESLTAGTGVKAFLLGRALAIQRKLLVPCYGRASALALPLYAKSVEAMIAKDNKLVRKAFRIGFEKGLNEYKTNKHYWKRYTIHIRNVHQAHGIPNLMKRFIELVRNK
jgi:GT2 family glycosyltransferase